MPDKIFRVSHADEACANKICLQDYDDALIRHQEGQFSLHRNDGGGAPSLQDFRSLVWGAANFSDRIQVHVHLPQQREMTLRLPDIATNGEVVYANIKTLMEMGAVEFWIPDHLCRPGVSLTSYFIYPVSNHRQFKEFIRVLDAAGPMHREAMGNIFGMMCMDYSLGAGDGTSVGESSPPSGPITGALEGLRVAILNGESSGCPDDDVDYFDEDTGKPVCYEPEPDSETELGHALNSAAAALGASLGAGALSAVTKGAHFALQSTAEKLLQNSIQEALKNGGGVSE